MRHVHYRLASPSCRAFSLTEILVSLAITSMILVLGFTVSQHTLEIWNGNQQILEKNAEARVAFAGLSSSLQTLTLRQRDVEWFAVKYDAPPTGPKKVSLAAVPWLRFVANQRAVSYRLAYRDPILNEGKSHPVFGLYRFSTGIDGLFGEKPRNPQDDPARIADLYWSENEERLTQPRSLEAMHTVDFKVRVAYRTAGGQPKLVPTGTTVRVIGPNVVTAPPVSGLNHASQLEAINVSLTNLTHEGAALLDAGAIDLASAIQEYGQHFATRIEIHPGGAALP